MMRIALVTIVMVLCGGAAPAQQVPSWTLSARPLVSIGSVDGDERYTLNNIASVVVLGDGRFAIAERTTPRIRVYGPDGRHVADWGRSGEGPGEYRYLGDMSSYRGDSIAAFDMVLRRITVLDSQGRVGRIVPVRLQEVRTPGMVPGESCCTFAGAFADGSFIAATPDMTPNNPGGHRFAKQTFYRLSADGLQIDSLGTWPSGLYAYDSNAPNRLTDVRFSPGLFYTVHGNRLFLGNGSDQAIDVVSSGHPARKIGTIRVNHPVVLVNRDVHRQAEANIRATLAGNQERLERALESYRNAEYARTLPVYSWLFTDPAGNLWVFRPSMAAPRGEPVPFDIFDSQGRLIATLTVPFGKQPIAITANTLVVTERDSNGVEYIRAYSINRNAR